MDAYPLSWPVSWLRTRVRRSAPFGLNFARSRDSLIREIHLLGGRDVILSTNISLRQDGLPYANQPQPDDPGVAVYFRFKDKPMVFACDKHTNVKDNVRAIGKTIEALRGIERWGASDMMERAFTGFQALPPPEGKEPWFLVLQLPESSPASVVEAQYRRLRSAYHPDKPHGDSAQFRRVQQAYETWRNSK
jgi:hypothetical protein